MFPPIPLDVLLAITQRFPERSPKMGEQFGDLMVRAGEANVVRFIQRMFDEQQDNILTTEMTQDVLA